MTDSAPSVVENPSWQDQLVSLLTSYAQAQVTYKTAALNAKAKLLLAQGQSPPQTATSLPASSGPSAFATWAPWVAGGLVVVAVFVALRR